jgi:hypothetical protein
MYVNGPVVVVGINIDIGIEAGVGAKMKEEQECEQDRSRTGVYRIGSVAGQDWLNGLRCTYLVCRGNKLHIEDGDYPWRRTVLPETFTTGGPENPYLSPGITASHSATTYRTAGHPRRTLQERYGDRQGI